MAKKIIFGESATQFIINNQNCSIAILGIFFYLEKHVADTLSSIRLMLML